MTPLNFKKILATTSSERKGTAVLIFILFVLVLFYGVDDWLYDVKPVSVEVEELAPVEKIEKIEQEYQKEVKDKAVDLFQFDPNVIGKSAWVKLGFSQKQAQSILNFRNSGFHFYKKEDLKKLFVVDAIKYKQLAPYVVIADLKEKQEHKKCYRVFIAGAAKPIYKGFEKLGQVFYRKSNQEYQYYSNAYATWELAENQLKIVEESMFSEAYVKKTDCNLKVYPVNVKNDTAIKIYKKKKQIVYLNKADTSELMSLTGIGRYYAKKIIDYRTKLGGFYKKEQLLEVYGVKQEVLEDNPNLIEVDSSLVQQININLVSKEGLKSHPYIKWSVANSIILYRANHGKYKKIEDIKKSVLVDDKLYEKIKRYLTIK